MPKIQFLGPDPHEVDVAPGTSVLEAARACGAQVGSACGGNLACSTCHVWVRQGLDSLPEIDEREDAIMDKAFDLRPEARLGCQARCSDADLVVEITRESRKAFLDEHPDQAAAATR